MNITNCKLIAYTLVMLIVRGQSAHAQPAQPKKDSAENLSAVVVSASRVGEKIMQAPVTIEHLDLRAIRHSSQPSFFDAIENIKGIQLITPSLGFKVINARGFTNTTNVRFVQMVDGMDIQAPHIGAPMANALGPGDLDILRVEVLPGMASALYGMNAINGTANFIVKDPFLYQGLTVMQKTGVNHVSSDLHDPALFIESSLRWAKAWNNKFAIKVNSTYSRGYDWVANDLTDLNELANLSTGLTVHQNPGKDLVNVYGDEASNRRTLTLGGKQYVVSRTGYAERDMASYDLDNIKGDLTMAYRPSAHVQLSYTFRIARSNTIYQRTNRFRLDNYITSQHSLTLSTRSVQFRAYINSENTGDSYNIRSMAENIDRQFKSDNDWFADFSRQYKTSVSGGSTVPAAMEAARSFADKGRPQPNTAETAAIIDRLRDINNWDQGAALRVKASMVHAEVQHTLTDDLFKKLNTRHKLSLLYGADYREYIVVPDGNYFINPVKQGSNLHYRKAGGFIQATKYFFGQSLKINAVLRVDKNQYFEARLNPRLSMVYSPVQQHNFRLALQQGYRFPSLFEAFSNINSGGVKRVGGLPVMSNGIFENSYLRASVDAFQAANTKDVNTNGLTVAQAVVKNQALLVRNSYTYIRPEEIHGIEAGYRASLLKNRLIMDVDFYYNVYHHLMAQIEANIPKATVPDSLLFYMNDRQKQDRYRLWTNSKTVCYNFATTMGVSWNFYRAYTVGGNVTLSRLDRTTRNDGLEDGYNTPKWMYNLYIGNPHLWSRFGFQANFRWQSRYLWVSSLATEWLPPHNTVDAQVQYHPIKDNWGVKVGASNLFNTYYYSFAGGPSIKGLYYCTLTCKVL
ncbi:TonB-dependent receptor [Paraflavitalea sp. CAU 1676]|uniref:TonB-dependent receptor n=1 Tax=Paraflavitalea sp. CAU 1676 TaxID=3032598 RepID=UPI0023DBD0F4|nr:TonB-dependent receptor [Paraflavitalea sp. CAU 1676]MDF2191529.1 TonB-dependent receptor [Paraflavitalea sp. CAU 1676]